MAGREPENYFPYEDSLSARVQGKLMQYCDMMKEEGLQNRRDKETIQELVSDISHQVKTPVANIKMFTGILKKKRSVRGKTGGISVNSGRTDQ